MSINPKQIVQAGYDRISYAYRPDQADEKLRGKYREWIGCFDHIVPIGGEVLDLGCGCAVPGTQLLAEKYTVTGVDISAVQIERAKRLVPNARFICADMTGVEFETGRFDAVACLYALIHVPVEEQKELLSKMVGWIRTGGCMLVTVGHRAWTGAEKDWLGVEGGTMYWSHADEATYIQWIDDLGLEVCWHRFVPEGTGGHTLIFAKKSELASTYLQ